jgi:hypothetical protein
MIARAVPGTRRVQQRITGGRKSSTSSSEGMGSLRNARSVVATFCAVDVPERKRRRALRK